VWKERGEILPLPEAHEHQLFFQFRTAMGTLGKKGSKSRVRKERSQKRRRNRERKRLTHELIIPEQKPTPPRSQELGENGTCEKLLGGGKPKCCKLVG